MTRHEVPGTGYSTFPTVPGSLPSNGISLPDPRCSSSLSRAKETMSKRPAQKAPLGTEA